jgi:hypothetical protein
MRFRSDGSYSLAPEHQTDLAVHTHDPIGMQIRVDQDRREQLDEPAVLRTKSWCAVLVRANHQFSL